MVEGKTLKRKPYSERSRIEDWPVHILHFKSGSELANTRHTRTNHLLHRHKYIFERWPEVVINSEKEDSA